MRQSKIFQHPKITNTVPMGAGSVANLRGDLVAYRLTFVTGHEALAIQRADVPIQNPRVPVLICGFEHAPEARRGILDPEEGAVVSN